MNADAPRHLHGKRGLQLHREFSLASRPCSCLTQECRTPSPQMRSANASRLARRPLRACRDSGGICTAPPINTPLYFRTHDVQRKSHHFYKTSALRQPLPTHKLSPCRATCDTISTSHKPPSRTSRRSPDIPRRASLRNLRGPAHRSIRPKQSTKECAILMLAPRATSATFLRSPSALNHVQLLPRCTITVAFPLFGPLDGPRGGHLIYPGSRSGAKLCPQPRQPSFAELDTRPKSCAQRRLCPEPHDTTLLPNPYATSKHTRFALTVPSGAPLS